MNVVSTLPLRPVQSATDLGQKLVADEEVIGDVPQLQENRRQGEVERDPQGEESCGNGVSVVGVEPDAQQELSGCESATSAFSAGCAEGDRGVGSQAR